MKYLEAANAIDKWKKNGRSITICVPSIKVCKCVYRNGGKQIKKMNTAEKKNKQRKETRRNLLQEYKKHEQISAVGTYRALFRIYIATMCL